MRISDWSSDVCSSDLQEVTGDQRDLAADGSHADRGRDRSGLAEDRGGGGEGDGRQLAELKRRRYRTGRGRGRGSRGAGRPIAPAVTRSEERRVGKECVSAVGSGGAPDT